MSSANFYDQYSCNLLSYDDFVMDDSKHIGTGLYDTLLDRTLFQCVDSCELKMNEGWLGTTFKIALEIPRMILHFGEISIRYALLPILSIGISLYNAGLIGCDKVRDLYHSCSQQPNEVRKRAH